MVVPGLGARALLNMPLVFSGRGGGAIIYWPVARRLAAASRAGREGRDVTVQPMDLAQVHSLQSHANGSTRQPKLGSH
jgi:hypothetical protein